MFPHSCPEFNNALDNFVKEENGRYYSYDPEADETYGPAWSYCVYCGDSVVPGEWDADSDENHDHRYVGVCPVCANEIKNGSL